jgi:4-hydroxybenzoate polyprenyltransferase
MSRSATVPAMKTTASRLLFLIQVSRPIIWPVLPLVYALGLHAAHAEFSAFAIAQMVLLTFPMNLIGCGLNDIYDYESDRLSTRRQKIWAADVTPETRPFLLQACVAMMPLVILGACLTRNRDNFMATASLVAMAWIYSVPPYRLKERPPLDSIANGLGYFLLPLMMGYSMNGNPREMPARYYLLALCVAGVHALATAADYDADRAAGHRTLAATFGKRVAASLACAAFVVSWWFGDFESIAVRVYLATCMAGTALATLLPQQIVVTGACVIIFTGFLLAAPFYIAGF